MLDLHCDFIQSKGFFFSCLFLLFYQFIENEMKQLIVVKLLYSTSLGFNTTACIRWRKSMYLHGATHRVVSGTINIS